MTNMQFQRNPVCYISSKSDSTQQNMTASRREDIDASPLKDLATILNVMATAI